MQCCHTLAVCSLHFPLARRWIQAQKKRHWMTTTGNISLHTEQQRHQKTHMNSDLTAVTQTTDHILWTGSRTTWSVGSYLTHFPLMWKKLKWHPLPITDLSAATSLFSHDWRATLGYVLIPKQHILQKKKMSCSWQLKSGLFSSYWQGDCDLGVTFGK